MSSSRSRKAPRPGLIAAFADACRERRRRADVDMEPRAPLDQTMTVAAFGGSLPEARPAVGKECRMLLTEDLPACYVDARRRGLGTGEPHPKGRRYS